MWFQGERPGGISLRASTISSADAVDDQIVAPADRQRLQRPDTESRYLLQLFDLTFNDRRIIPIALRRVEQNLRGKSSPAGAILKPNAIRSIRNSNRIVEFDGNLRTSVEGGAFAIVFLDDAQLGRRHLKAPSIRRQRVAARILRALAQAELIGLARDQRAFNRQLALGTAFAR